MSKIAAPDEWRALGSSQRGAHHSRRGIDNQDAIHWLPESGIGPPLILAVADGHGDRLNFRSQIGSRLAVAAAEEVIYAELSSLPEKSNLSLLKFEVEDRLPRRIVRRWSEMVDVDVKAAPFQADELARLDPWGGGKQARQVQDNPTLAYGSTLLAVLVNRAFIVYLQIGDGDILIVTPGGDVHPPLPPDQRLFGNSTTSLCEREAWRNFRVRFQALEGSLDPPALILLSTDGYANSFKEPAGFEQAAIDIHRQLQAGDLDQEIAAIRESLPGWLAEISQQGSGDDVTQGILCRMSAYLRQSHIIEGKEP